MDGDKKSATLWATLTSACLMACGDAVPHAPAPVVGTRLDEPIAVIGVDDELPGHDLYRVQGALLVGDTTLVIADGGSDELRWFNLSGHLIRRRGGTGGGEYEFGHIAGLWSHDDKTIAAYDDLRQRYTLWSVDGELIDAARPESDRQVSVYGPFGNGFVGGYRQNPMVRHEGDIIADSLVLHRYGRGGEKLALLDTVPIEVIIGTIHPVANRLMQSRLPLAPRGFVAANGGGLVYGFGSASFVSFLHSDAPDVEFIEVPWSTRTLTSDGADAYKDEWTARIDRSDRARRRYVEEFELPDTLPRFDGLFLDMAGRVWLQKTPDPRADSAEWHIIDPDGTTSFPLVLGKQTTVRYADATHVIISAHADSLAETVVLYTLPAQMHRPGN